MFPYAAAKSGLVGLTRSLALDYAPLGIRVNAVLPGLDAHAAGRGVVRAAAGSRGRRAAASSTSIPCRRIATPKEVANLVAFVASDEASAITGASLAVDCGLGIRFAT